MLLHQLLHEYDPTINLHNIPDRAITGICEDSRHVEPGQMFVARSGTKTEGTKFIEDARIRGAVAVLVGSARGSSSLPRVVVSDLGRAVSPLANIFYGQPSHRLRVLGVTGTNGKTTTTYLIRHLMKKNRHRCGLVGTVEIDDGKNIQEATMTTPGAVEIARLLGTMRDKGCRACAMEVSSHALHQNRVSGVRFAGAAFTNLTGDHLDYHGTMENYGRAKAMLFDLLGDDAVAVVNADDAASTQMVARCQGRIMRFGFGRTADYRARDVALTGEGSNFTLQTPEGRAEVKFGLIGKHNIANALTAAALIGEVFGLTAQQIADGLKDATGAPGRLQRVQSRQPFSVLVDYAHTDDALENVLTALRPITGGKLRVLFGCGGDRDRTKRPRMARTAARLADVVYVTSDNPRTEDPLAIIDQIVGGFSPRNATPVVIEPDRREAIHRVLAEARAGDVVLLAGKGHENYQIIGDIRHPFDDVEIAGYFLRGSSSLATTDVEPQPGIPSGELPEIAEKSP